MRRAAILLLILNLCNLAPANATSYTENVNWFGGESCASGNITVTDDWSYGENVSYPGKQASIKVSLSSSGTTGTMGEAITCSITNLSADLLIDGIKQTDMPIIVTGNTFSSLEFTTAKPGTYSIRISGIASKIGEYGLWDSAKQTWSIKPPVATSFNITQDVFKVMAGTVPKPFLVSSYACPSKITISTKKQYPYSCNIIISDSNHVADSLGFYPINSPILGRDFVDNPILSSVKNWKRTIAGWQVTLKFTQQPVTPVEFMNLRSIENVRWRIVVTDEVPSGNYLKAELYVGEIKLVYKK